MNRRNFLKKSFSYGLGTATALSLGAPATKAAMASATPDLVAIRGGSPGDMFDMAIKRLGGMPKFVKRGQKVVVKPNIGWNAPPDWGANTNPELVARIVKRCLDAGAKEVTVFDHTADVWTKCYKSSGIEQAAKDAGAKVAPGNNERYYHLVELPGAMRLKKVKVHELVLEADVFINVPVVKDHVSTGVTCAMKNLMGIVWDRGYYHKNNLHKCIADFAAWRKADLTVVDAYNVVADNGPTGVTRADIMNLRSLLVTTDPVAADTAAVKLLGRDPGRVHYIRYGEKTGLGTSDLSTLNIDRIKL